MSNGAIYAKGIACKGDLPAFKQQFPAFVQNFGHGQALKFKLLTDVVDTFHDQNGFAKANPTETQLDNELTEGEKKS